MTHVRVKTYQENLIKREHFSIDFVVTDYYTHEIQLTQLPEQKVLVSIAVDPTDRTVAGCIDADNLIVLGDEARAATECLSRVLLEQFGAKQLMIVTSEATFASAYQSPEQLEFKRFRSVHRKQLFEETKKILGEYKTFTAELDEKCYMATDEESLLKHKSVQERYQEISGILAQSGFTPGKLTEYKQEELQGKLSRFKSQLVKSIVILDRNSHDIVGMVRALEMGNRFSYLSDEVMRQDLISLERFSGNDESQKKIQRETFLLAYIMNKASQALLNESHLFAIAAEGRESVYAQVGFEQIPKHFHGWKAVINLSAPMPALIHAQERIKALPALGSNATRSSYQKYLGAGVVFLGLGLFAYSLYKKPSSNISQPGMKCHP